MPIFEPDTDAAFHDWLERHPAGFVVNSDRKPAASFLALHRGDCRTINDPRRKNYAGKDYPKRCSTSKPELMDWARDKVGGQPRACPFCKP